MNSLYTEDVRNLYYSIRFPKGLVIQIVEEEFNLLMVFYRNNISAFDGVDQARIGQLVAEFLQKVRDMGIPIFTQVKEGDGRDART